MTAVENPDIDGMHTAAELFDYRHQIVEEKRKNPNGSRSNRRSRRPTRRDVGR